MKVPKKLIEIDALLPWQAFYYVIEKKNKKPAHVH